MMRRIRNRYREQMRYVARAVVGVVVAVIAAKRFRHARQVYVQEVPSASKPIEAVGTAVAAFIGFAPKRPTCGKERSGTR